MASEVTGLEAAQTFSAPALFPLYTRHPRAGQTPAPQRWCPPQRTETLTAPLHPPGRARGPVTQQHRPNSEH